MTNMHGFNNVKFNVREFSKPQISHKDMVLGSSAFLNFLAPARVFHRNTNGLLNMSGNLMRTRNSSCQARLFPKIAKYSRYIPYFDREEEDRSTANARGVLRSVTQCFSALLIVKTLVLITQDISPRSCRHSTLFCDGCWYRTGSNWGSVTVL
jgi:hypothetical protein